MKTRFYSLIGLLFVLFSLTVHLSRADELPDLDPYDPGASSDQTPKPIRMAKLDFVVRQNYIDLNSDAPEGVKYREVCRKSNIDVPVFDFTKQGDPLVTPMVNTFCQSHLADGRLVQINVEGKITLSAETPFLHGPLKTFLLRVLIFHVTGDSHLDLHMLSSEPKASTESLNLSTMILNTENLPFLFNSDSEWLLKDNFSVQARFEDLIQN